MFCRSVNLLFCTFLTVVTATDYSDSGCKTGSDPEIVVYRLRRNNPGEMLTDDHAAKMAGNLGELIMAHEAERQLRVINENNNFEEKDGAIPHYVSVIPIGDHCMVNNGNCSQKCETVGLQTVCSCHEGYTLTTATTCTATSRCDVVLSGTSGEFTIDKGYCQWIIKAPDHHIVKLTLHTASGYDDDDDVDPNALFGEIYDGNSTGANIITYIRPNTYQTVLKSSGQYVLIKSLQAWNYYPHTQRISYVTGSKFLEMNYDNTFGHLTIPVTSLSVGGDCFFLTYSIPKHGTLSARLNEGDNRRMLQLLTPEFTFKHDGKWKRDIFRIPFHEGATVLKFDLIGGTNVHNFGRCINLEYHAIGGKLSIGPETVCRNGGVWSNTTQSCTCPQGFVGIYCEEGCGPNRYGENCSKVCSFLPSACEGMIFCTKESCSCAPGLQGVNCDSPCDSGKYGASCQQHCGKCKDDVPCDRYTGICYSGCATGFYPPLCQRTYKVLMNAPDIVAVTYNSLKIRVSFQNTSGEGHPVFYEVQYKEEEQSFWSKMSPRKIPSITEFGIIAEIEIMGLFPGKVYETRVTLIDKDGGTYQTDIPKSKAITKCVDPLNADYKFSAKVVDDINGTSVLLEWSYEHDVNSLICQIVAFELSVLCGSEHLKYIITEKEGSKKLSDILPEMSYSFQMIGKTVTGKSTLPIEIALHTPHDVPGRVRAVKAAPLVSGRQLNVTWLPPWNSQGKSLRYKVTYQCLHLLACDGINCNTSSGDAEVTTRSALLCHLQPHAMYRIEVASVSPGGLASASYIITALTADTAPHVRPSAAESPILSVTNTSVSINWMPPEDCSALNGYIYGYSYSLVENNTEEIIQQGTVPENILSVNFSDLVPTHCYDAHIAVVSSGGTSTSDVLKIPFCTTSTAPDRVQSLSVYKRGRRMVGLRWSPPVNTYGDIQSFTITYSREGSSHSRKLVTEPKHCGAWIDLYCYTISGLSPGKKYHFEVQARNKEVSIDGEPTAVEAITSEGASTPPVNLRIINSTENSMFVEWGMPENINGQLRSFIIIVEQIDTQVNSDECCDDIPLQDYRVASEEPIYVYEITGLSAASTYSVTVSAKTVTLGEESRIMGHTYPPKASLPQNALVIVETESSSYKPDVVTLQMHPAKRINGVNRKYILLHLTNDSTTQQQFHDELDTTLQSRFTENYHLISEYTQEEIENQPVVTLHLKELGFVSTEIQSQKYALILIQDYMGNRSMDIFVTEETGV